jgi:hypothetical protein
MTREEEFWAQEDGDGGGREVGFTASIAELANGEQGLATERREEVGNTGSSREVREIKVGHVGGAHGGVIGEMDHEGAGGGAHVAETGSIKGKKVTGAAGVGDEGGWGAGGRT